MVCQAIYGVSSGILLLGNLNTPIQLASVAQGSENIQSQLASLQTLPKVISDFSVPDIDKPDWYKKQQDAEIVQKKPVTKHSNGKVVTYSISTKGATSANLAEFSAQVSQTLNDNRGWARLGISFREVKSGGNFNLILSEASQLPSFSSGCSVEWSCRVGRSVIINDSRWMGATSAWNSAGGDIRNYRHMVINHEVGHWLGHGHLGCAAPGALAPIMQQQSINLQGCAFNPWPLESELWSTTLGIK